MTVPSTPRIAGPFLGTGGGTTGPFPFTYPIFATTDVLVVENVSGIQNTLTINSDYTVAMNADQTNNPGGTVTLTVAIFTGSGVTLGSQVPQTQATVLTNLGGFLPTVLNNALDKVTILIQQLALTVGSALSFPISDGNAVSGTLPTAALRANQFLAFNSSGNPIASPGPSTTPISTAMVPVVQAASLASALSTLGGVAITAYNTAIALLAPLASPSFTGPVTVSALTASQLIATNGSKVLTSVTALPTGTTAATQTAADNSIKVATTAYADRAATAVSTAASMVRLNTANGFGSTNTAIRRFTNVVTNNGPDITYADSATLGASFTVNTAGAYAISYNDQFSAIQWFGISLNSNQLATSIPSISVNAILCATVTQAASNGSACSVVVYLNVNDVVRPHITTSAATGSNPWACQFTIARVQ